MLKTIITLLLFVLPITTSCLQQAKNNFNFGFEKFDRSKGMPDHWINWSTKGYTLKLDSIVRHSGRCSLLIESESTRAEGSFGCAAFTIPADYKGENIEVRAYMKMDNISEGQIGLMLRIDGPAGGLQFENLQEKDIHGTSDWTQYSVKLPLPENATVIYIGPILSGTGRLWTDDIQVLIDGKEINKALHKSSVSYKAREDHEFDEESSVKQIELTPGKTDDLVLLGKLWGFLKYYHPAIAKGNYNWDYELFRILPKILNSKSKTERNEILSKWVDKLSKKEKIVSAGSIINEPDSLISLKPDLNWITCDSIIGKKLPLQLKAIQSAQKPDHNYYIGFVQGIGNPVIQNENSYTGEIVHKDAGYRLLSLYRYWNIIEYFYPNRNLIGRNWDDVLKDFIPEFIEADSAGSYILTVLKLVAEINDTHANIWGYNQVLENLRGSYYAPVNVMFIEGKAVITGNINDVLSKNSGLRIGDIITSINRISIDSIIKKQLPYTPASNYPTQLRIIASNLLRSSDSIELITYKRDNIERSIQIKCYPPSRLGNNKPEWSKDTCFKMVTPQIAYINPGSIKNNYLPSIIKNVEKTRGLIIDMRCYPSEFIVFSLGEFLMPEPVPFVKFSVTNLKAPGLFMFTDPLQVGSQNKNYYKGKVIIIVNEITQSQAEYTTMAFRKAPGAIVIGSTTAGADGNVSFFKLPGSINTAISGIGVFYPDGTGTQRVGIVPDIFIRPTIKGISEGRDELLDEAVRLIGK